MTDHLVDAIDYVASAILALEAMGDSHPFDHQRLTAMGQLHVVLAILRNIDRDREQSGWNAPDVGDLTK
jgi:hypothetical protein